MGRHNSRYPHHSAVKCSNFGGNAYTCIKVPKFYFTIAVRIGLLWPSVSTQVLIRKLKYLSKLLSSDKDILSTRMFNSVAMMDVYNCSIVQQCRMLEAELGTNCCS